ncbi:hypothetical protein M9H77_21002 [Catharanthus roseus]|uniref:Uncharacterized protein n=1 Tax=Catharanthus roseus TaxID=4058 RepID=A0ACC0AND8_CATRO|nr:hypothetical protein M9H77_21002 [Catharanthus roseus]
MHVTSFVADALGVVTICLVAVLVFLGLFCILYSFYFHNRVHDQRFAQLGYFGGPWITRIAFSLFAIWWGFGEIIRLNLLRRNGRLLNALSSQWQERVCKCYIVSNLGFAEPCLFLTLIFLLRASLQKSGTLSRKWNCRTLGFVLLFCLPMVALQLVVTLAGPDFYKENHKLPAYFTRITTKPSDNHDVILCTYPLLSTLLLGLFATILTAYLFLLGRQILHLVINKCLQKRVYALIFSVSGFLPLRVLLLGLSVRFRPESLLFEFLSFLAFLSLLCCVGAGICLLVYLPVADSLALRNLQRDIEARGRVSDEHNDTVSLIANQGPHGEDIASSPGRNSAASTKRGSISFRAMERDETSGAYVELSLFSPSRHSTSPGSPSLLGWPMLPSAQTHGGEPNM